MSLKVLLATTVNWPSAGRLAGAFHAAGCTVDAVMPGAHPAMESRYLSRRHLYWAMTDISSFNDAIEASSPDLVVALDDRAIAVLLRVRERASPDTRALIERSLGNTAHYPQLMSRFGFIEAARAAHIHTPITRAVAGETDLDAALIETGFPAVLKADGTWGGDGVVIVKTRDEAVAALHKLSDPPSRLRNLARALRRSDAHFLRAALDARPAVLSIQQFIAGKPATTSFACWKGKLLAANHLEAVSTADGNGPAGVLQRIECRDMDTAAARLAARFELSGLHGLDYMRDADGRPHLIEINPRAPQSSYLSFGFGHDLVTALISKLGSQAVPPRPRVPGETVAMFPQEWMRSSSTVKSAYHDVPWDDPALIRAWISSRQARPSLVKWERLLADRRTASGGEAS